MVDKINVVHIDAECPICDGSGVYRGITTPPLIGEVCKKCGGSGKTVIEYTPFTERKKRDDVLLVCRDSYRIPIAQRSGHEDITYKQFLAGEFPPNNCRA